MRENPELAEQYPELQSVADSARSSQAKEAGNRAFASKNYNEAVVQFSAAIQLRRDPIFYSNRAAAYHALKRWIIVRKSDSWTTSSTSLMADQLVFIYPRYRICQMLGSTFHEHVLNLREVCVSSFRNH